MHLVPPLDFMFKGHKVHYVLRLGDAIKDVSLHGLQVPIGEVYEFDGE